MHNYLSRLKDLTDLEPDMSLEEFIEAFERIQNPEIRASIMALVTLLADAGAGAKFLLS